jgi:3-oxoadipate enol-lactonase
MSEPALPVLVLGNSLGTTSLLWRAQAPVFAERFRLLHYDLPGHGGAASPASAEGVSIGSLGAGVLGLMDEHGIDQVAYCGVSMGGMVGMWLAANAPDRISSLGLICTSAYLPPAQGWRARAELVLAGGLAAVAEQSIGRWFTPSFIASSPELVASFKAGLLAVDPLGYASCCLAIANLDLRADLASVRAPTLVISGADDPATPPEHGAAIAAGISGARHLVVDGAHLANVASPAKVASAMLGHFSATI